MASVYDPTKIKFIKIGLNIKLDKGFIIILDEVGGLRKTEVDIGGNIQR